MSRKQIYFLIIYFTFINTLFARRNALETFVSNKHVDTFKITILTDASREINTTWIEYNYVFVKKSESVNNSNQFSALSVDFPCEESTDLNLPIDRFKWYQYEILNILKEVDNNFLDENVVFRNDTIDTDLVYDIVVCQKDKTDLSKEYSPLYNIFSSRYALVYKKLNKSKDIFVQTFVGTLWLCFLGVLFLLAVCLRISTYYYSHIYRNTRLWTWVEITLWAIASACQQGFSYTPTRITSRIFFLWGYIISYVLYTAFTAAITSVLVQQEKVSPNINNYRLVGYQVDLRTLDNHRVTTFANNLGNVFRAVDSGANIGVAPLMLVKQFMENKGLSINNYTVIPLGRSYGEYRNHWWLHKRFSSHGYIEKLNSWLMKLSEGGILQLLKNRFLVENKWDDSVEGYSSASLEHVLSAVLLFASGLALAVIFLIFELGFYGIRYRNR